MTQLEIKMRLPPTLNDMLDAARKVRYSKHGKVLGSKYSDMKKQWGNAIGTALSDQITTDGNPWTECWVSVLYCVSFGHDPDNLAACQKFVMDALVDDRFIRLIKNDNLTVIQTPVVHQFEKAKKADECVIFTISDRPIWKLEKLPCDELFCADLKLPGEDRLPRRKRNRFKKTA